MKKILAFLTVFVFIMATSHTALAADYAVELVVQDGKKTKETDAVLRTNGKNFEIIVEKNEFKQFSKTFDYDDIKSADYSFSKSRCFRAAALWQRPCWSALSLRCLFSL